MQQTGSHRTGPRMCHGLIGFGLCIVSLVMGSSLGAAGAGHAADPVAPARMKVPGTWRGQAAALDGYDGFAWYRANLTVPPEWLSGQLVLYVEKVEDACETFFNGARIGVAGKMPPAYESGLAAAEHRYVIPREIVRPDGPNVVAIRVYDHDGDAGFKGIAPCLLGGGKAVSLEGEWEFRIGDDPSWAAAPVADLPPFATIGPAPQLGRFATVIRRQAQAGPLPPEESLSRFKLPDDLAVDLVLAEPDVRQPLFLDFDARGRLWVLEYLQYPEPAGLTLLSKDAYWRAVYDKVPLPPPSGVRGADRITIHEDTDGDGSLDAHKTFLDGLNIATSFAQGIGGVYVLNPPYLLFYADADGDDVPDGDPEVLLEGFGLEDTHSVVNSLRFGPDGWLYAAQGSTVTAAVRRPGATPVVRSQGQNIWRYHPPTRTYEIFAEGGGNAFGVEIDSAGRIFSGHNGGNTRGFHYMQGAYLQKGFGKHGPLSNPFAFGYFPPMEHGDYTRFTHTFLVYEAELLPERYRGRLLAVNPMTNHVIVSERLAAGSTFRTRDVGFAIESADSWFRPVDIKEGPDGAVYVADWYDGQLAHTANYQGGIDRDHGRVWRIRPRSPAAGSRGSPRCDLTRGGRAELLALIAHPDRWQRQEGVAEIRRRGPDPAIAGLLAGRLGDPATPNAIDALWALHAAGGLDEPRFLACVAHPRPEVRAWAWRLWFDEHDRVTGGMAARLVSTAAAETDAEVLCQIASSTRRVAAAETALEILRPVVAGAEKKEDPRLPLLAWWAIESRVAGDTETVLAWFADGNLFSEPLVAEEILPRLMRRFAASGQRADLAICSRLLSLADGPDSTAALVRGFEEAFRGRSLAGVPDELLARVSAAGASFALRVRQGDAAAVAEAIATLADEKAAPARRIECAEVLGEVRHEPAVGPLLDVVERTADDAVRVAALSALGGFADARVPDRVIGRLAAWPEEVREAARALLVTRKEWVRPLLEAVDRGDIDPRTFPVDVVRAATFFRDPRIAEIVGRRFPELDGGSSAAMQEQAERLAGVLAVGGGDPYRGKALYGRSCGKCHLLHGVGGQVGPDLTSFKRDEVPRLLHAIVNPSAEIRAGYETHVAVMGDGRVVQGLLVDDDPRVLVLRDAAGRTLRLDRAEIEERQVSRTSLMPAAQLDALSDAEVRDLFAYLRSTQPLAD